MVLIRRICLKSRALLVCDHFLNSHDVCASFNSDTVWRNWMLVTLRDFRLISLLSTKFIHIYIYNIYIYIYFFFSAGKCKSKAQSEFKIIFFNWVSFDVLYNLFGILFSASYFKSRVFFYMINYQTGISFLSINII